MQVMCGVKNIYTERSLMTNFNVCFPTFNVLRCWFTTLAKDPRHVWSPLELISAETNI